MPWFKLPGREGELDHICFYEIITKCLVVLSITGLALIVAVEHLVAPVTQDPCLLLAAEAAGPFLDKDSPVSDRAVRQVVVVAEIVHHKHRHTVVLSIEFDWHPVLFSFRLEHSLYEIGACVIVY